MDQKDYEKLKKDPEIQSLASSAIGLNKNVAKL